MKEGDANEYLVNHGITCDINPPQVVEEQGVSTDYGLTWTTSYPLKGNCMLDLEFYHADSPETWTNKNTGWERDGILEGAEMESNWVKIISIKLTNSK
jgi:hypothetical protein